VAFLASCSEEPASEPSPAAPEGVVEVAVAVATGQVAEDPDDPAIWIHPTAPEKSLILGTNKVEAPAGALVVFGLDGNTSQTVGNLDRPNNVDVEYSLPLGGELVDIAVVTERIQQRLRVFRIAPDGSGLTEISSENGLAVFDGFSGEEAAPMGIALYRRPRDGAIFAIVGRKSGPAEGYLWQYRLEDDGAGRVKATKVREFGGYSGINEIEAIAVDDALGYVYYSDEGYGIHKWAADPDDPNAGQELAHFGTEGFEGDHEGIAIYAREDGAGYLICSDQLEGNSEYQFYAREGKPGNPHDHSEVLKTIRGGADSTDGVEATSAALGPQFPNGVLVAMNSGGLNFLIFRWEDVAGAGSPQLKIGRK
jgi:3-phytase